MVSQLKADEPRANHSEPSDPRIISADAQHRAFKSAQRHTRRIKWLRWGAPLVAIAIVAGFVGWVIQKTPELDPVEVTVEETSLKQDRLIMQNPRLTGFSDGRAYEVLAVRAIQQVATPDVVDLERLSARINDDKNQWATVTAKAGRFDQTKQILDLEEDVTVKSSLGYGLTTDAVNIDMQKGYMRTLNPVRIQSSDILLEANQLEAIENGEQFRLTGNVKLRIDAALINKTAGTGARQKTPADNTTDQPQGEGQ